MEHRHDLHSNNNILKTLSKLPRKIVSVNSDVNIPEFVLYDFCNEACFNFGKVAYFINNPDFNCFKGVAGISKEECIACAGIPDVWQKPEQFKSIMQKSAFNTRVRSIEKCNISPGVGKDKEVIKTLADELAFAKPDYYSWLSKHNNTGYLIFERSSPGYTNEMQEHLSDGVYLLSFCPIA